MDYSNFEDRTMRYVLEIAKYGNITHAAKELYITQSALSKFLLNLEEKLGFPLFNRYGHQLVPTYEGERFLYYAENIVRLDKQLEDEMKLIENDLGGRLRVGLPIFRASCITQRIIPPFIDKYPDVELFITEDHCHNLGGRLLESDVDIVITTVPINDPGIELVPVRKNNLYIGTAMDHPNVEKYGSKDGSIPEIDIRRFKDDKFILQYPGQHIRDMVDSIFKELDYTPKVSLITRSVPTAMELAARGYGVCFLADIYADFKTHLPLYLFKVNIERAQFDIYLAYRKNIYLPDYFQDFIDIVKEYL